MGKLRKLKISKIKRNNHTKNKLSQQGKLKSKRHTPKKQTHKPPVPRPETEEQEESDHGEDLMDMIEEDDLTFLQKAISNKSYNLLKQIHLNGPDEEQKTFGRKKKKIDNSQPIEELFENNISKIMKDNVGKSVRMLLPIKTKDGFVEKRIIEEENEISNDESTSNNNEEESKENDKENNSDMEMEVNVYNNLEKKDKNDKPVSTIELLAYREEILKSKRFKIGILSSGILENPENKIGNFKILLDFMDERKPEIYITVRKVTMLSLLEIFKDLLPLYNIHVSEKGVKLKKEIFALQNYEATLLRSYKSYLQRLEKISEILRRKRGDTRPMKEQEVQLGEIAVSCMCELLTVHPYFNFSVNIANYVLPFLDNKRSSVRERVAQCISQIFKEDKRGKLSLTIVRKLNQYIKAKKHSVYPEVITVLLSLRIKDVNLDKEKEEETKQKKLMSHKQRILALSKRERKKNKKLEQVEKELLETKAEENKQAKQKMLTEITSVVFTIYFRILKQAPNSKVLSACLEGLAKFAHCINIDFYQDLVGAIDRLIEEGNLGLREQLHCVQCIFTILSGQGTALNIDPYRFYAHLYKNLLNVHCGRTHAESEIVLKTLIQILIHQRKKITQAHVVAFVKRISTWALQSQHNTTLGVLGIVKQVMQLGKAAHGLLDTDCTGDGHYQSEILEPDYCNAHCTALWEIVALQRHYHSVVQQLAKNIAYAVPTNGEGSLPTEIAKLTPNELYTEYDPAGVAFKPSVPVPRNTVKKASINNNYTSNNLEQYLNAVNVDDLFVGEHVDFYKAYKSNL